VLARVVVAHDDPGITAPPRGALTGERHRKQPDWMRLAATLRKLLLTSLYLDRPHLNRSGRRLVPVTRAILRAPSAVSLL
jgi:hypothetical protein